MSATENGAERDLHSQPGAERDLLRRVAEGDEHAIESLFSAHATALWRIAYRYLHSENEAREVVEDVYVAVWHRRAALHVHGPFRAYLTVAVRNRALGVLRSDLRRGERDAQWLQERGDGPAPVPPPTTVDPMRRRVLARVEVALADLPERQRRVFELRVRQGKTVAEARAAIGARTNKAVERLYAHAVEGLRAKLWRRGDSNPRPGA